MFLSPFRQDHFFITSTLALLFSMAAVRADEPKDTVGEKPPMGANLLFDGKDLSGWTDMGGKPAKWAVKDGYVAVGRGDIRTKEKFGPDFQLHVEFWLPLMADKHDQARANSGVYLQGRYEIQVLDSYKNKTYAKGEAGAMYGILGTSKNANKPPEEWQTYDITFHSPRVDEKGKVTKPGHITVVFNGQTVIDNGSFDHVTGGAMDEKLGEPGPLRLQDHGCKVRFRNIWLLPLSAGDRGKKAAASTTALGPGQFLPGPFHFINLNGAHAGKPHCLVCEVGLRPAVAVFVRDRAMSNKTAGTLLQKLDEVIGRNPKAQLKGFVAFLGDDYTKPEGELAALRKIDGYVKGLDLKNLVACAGPAAGPEGYQIGKDAEVTILLYKEQKIVQGSSFPAGQLTESDVAAIAKAANELK
jgi:hypothetical protein